MTNSIINQIAEEIATAHINNVAGSAFSYKTAEGSWEWVGEYFSIRSGHFLNLEDAEELDEKASEIKERAKEIYQEKKSKFLERLKNGLL